MREVLLVLVGVLAAVVGTAGGITSLVSYPALLLLGLGRHDADVVNLVALMAGLPGSVVASRGELRELRSWWTPLSLVAAFMAAAGSLLLARTPPGVFSAVVPALVLLGVLALVLQPRLAGLRGLSGASAASRRRSALVWSALVSVYGGYFGAGGGVMLLVVALLFVDERLPVANAAKNLMVGVSAITSTLVLCLTTRVDWYSAALLGLGELFGSMIGPRIARRVPARVLRPVVAVLGVVFAACLQLHLL